jgi:hypothetical protein
MGVYQWDIIRIPIHSIGSEKLINRLKVNADEKAKSLFNRCDRQYGICRPAGIDER